MGWVWEPSDPGPVNLESSSGHGQEGFQPGMCPLFTTTESLREWKDAPPPHLGHSSIDKEAGDLVALSALFVPVGGWWLQMNSKVLMVNLKKKKKPSRKEITHFPKRERTSVKPFINAKPTAKFFSYITSAMNTQFTRLWNWFYINSILSPSWHL